MAMTPEQLAASGTEDGQQRALLLSLALNIRPHFPLIDLIYHIPNGGSRGTSRRDAQMAGAMMNALGVKRGMPDLHLPIPMQGYASLYIEMKKPKDGALSKYQVQRIRMLCDTGNAVAVIDDWRVGYALVYAYIYTAQQGLFADQYLTKEIGAKNRIFDPSNYFKVG